MALSYGLHGKYAYLSWREVVFGREIRVIGGGLAYECVQVPFCQSVDKIVFCLASNIFYIMCTVQCYRGCDVCTVR